MGRLVLFWSAQKESAGSPVEIPILRVLKVEIQRVRECNSQPIGRGMMEKRRLNRRNFIHKATGVFGAGWAASARPIEARPTAAKAQPSDGSEASSTSSVWFIRPDPSWVDKLSKPQYDIKFEFNVKKVNMRDGVMLSANIWRPKAEGRFPVIYLHVPYDKSNPSLIITRAKFFVPRGYAVVAIDNRGRYDSDGTHYLYWHTNWRGGGFEGQDVYDALAWLGQQPWSSGKIGMTGPSYLGGVQWLGAYLQPPSLTTIVPYVAADDVHDGAIFGGAYCLAKAVHRLSVLGNSRTNNDNLEKDFYDLRQQGPIYRHLPLRTLDEALLGRKEQFWQDHLDHPDNDDFWRMSVGHVPAPGEITEAHYPQVNVPSLNITGWYDTVQSGTINNFLGMARYGPERLRRKHHLIVGPWEHAVGPRVVGDLDFGPHASADSLPVELRFSNFFLRPVELRWFDYWLKGIENGIMDEPPVHIFRIGENAWRSEQEWPLSRAKETKYYLRSSGHANSRYGDGTLSTEVPGAEPTDSFVYDPENPVLTYGGTLSNNYGYGHNSDGPRDQRSIQSRNDVLVYTSEPTSRDIEVTGRIICKLYAASTAVDTDFTAKLLDVHPNGYAQILREGIIRARYRTSFEKQELISPGKVYEYTIYLWSLSNVFKKGHRIQVEISSSNFPMFDRNPNTGHKIGEDAQLQKATQTIYHSDLYPSHVILPVVPSS
ncbi:MAG: CocE/NonD family hydrolase [Acidobacteriota bacterium]